MRPTPSVFLVFVTLLLFLHTSLSWDSSHCNCTPVTNSRLCDHKCPGTCASPRRCPPWLQGQWKSVRGWELIVEGSYVSATILTLKFAGSMYCGTHLSPANTASLAGREWDILSQGESENDINVAIEWDVIPDTPTWMRNNRDIIRGVIRLGRTNLQSLPLNALQSISSPHSSSLDVLVKYGWYPECYTQGAQDTRYPSFSTLPLTSYDNGEYKTPSGSYYYDSLACSTTALSDTCPHWLHGSWNGSMTSIHATSLELDSWILSVSESGNAISVSTSNGRTFQYAVKCKKILHITTNKDYGQWKIDFTESDPSHKLRGVFLVTSNPSILNYVGAPFNWCQRPHNISIPSIYNFESDEPVPFRQTNLQCTVPPETGTCTTFISGNWSGYLLDDNGHAINLNITASFSSDRQNVRLVDKDGMVYEGRIQCDTSLRSLSIPGSEPMENWPESYLDIIYRWPTAKMNWTSHAIFKFTWGYTSFSISIGFPGKCAKPIELGTSTPPGFDTYKFFCSMSLLSTPCPDWLAGPRVSFSNNSNYVKIMSLNVSDSRTNAYVSSREVFNGNMKCSYSSDNEISLDVRGTGPSHFENWIKRFIIQRVDQKGTIKVIESPAGFCGRASYVLFNITGPETVPHPYVSTTYVCNTPLVQHLCPGWFEGNWSLKASSGNSHDMHHLQITGDNIIINHALSWKIKCQPTDINNDGKTYVAFDIIPKKSHSLYGHLRRGIAKFNQSKGSLELGFGPYGWCIRPDPTNPLENGPFSTAVFDCSVDMLAQICPPWVDGHWFINSNKILPLVRSSSGISSVYNMRVNGTSSQVYNITGFKDRSQTIHCDKSTFQKSTYVGDVLKVDLKYQLDIEVIERGYIHLSNADPVSKIHIDIAPHNWCQRPHYSSSKQRRPSVQTTRIANGTCATPKTTGNCPSWLQGHWKFFHDTKTSSKWIFMENQLKNEISNTTTAIAEISCEFLPISDTIRLDIEYSSPSLWSGRIFRALVQKVDRRKIEGLMPPTGWCSPPPKFVSTTPEAPYNYFEAYRVEVPTAPRSFVLAPAQETLGVRVDLSRSRLVGRFKSSSSDNYSPIAEYYVQYDIESPQQLVCFKNDNIKKLALGSCCNSDSDCMSNLCDKETFSCTLRCLSDDECKQITKRPEVECRLANWLPTSLHYAKYACNTSRTISKFGHKKSLCADICHNTTRYNKSKMDLGQCIFSDNATCNHLSCKTGFDNTDVSIVARFLVDSPCCRAIARKYCASANYYDSACYIHEIRSALGLTGSVHISSLALINSQVSVTVSNLSVGSRYYFSVYAKNEIGYSPPTLSMPTFETPRALPPPPAELVVQQVEPDERNNVTLELAKESLDVTFASPFFDNGDTITSYILEWDRRIQFDSRSEDHRMKYTCDLDSYDPDKSSEIQYGKCSSLCESSSGLCHAMNECPLSVEHQGNQICTDCNHEADNVAPIVFEDPDINCSILEDIERALVGTYGQCQNELSSIRGYARNPLGAIPAVDCNSTCIRNLTYVFSNIQRLNCNLDATVKYITSQLDRATTLFLCDAGIDGEPCKNVLKSYMDKVQLRSLNCRDLENQPCCSRSIGNFLRNVSNYLVQYSAEIVTLTLGERFHQDVTEKYVQYSNASLAIEYYNFLRTSCGSYFDHDKCLNLAYTYMPKNSTKYHFSHCTSSVRSYCKCSNPFDMGCTRYDLSKRLNFMPDGTAVIIANGKSQFYYRISSLNKRTAYRIRVSSVNSVGRGMARMSIAMPALMIPSKPLYANVMWNENSTRKQLSTSIILRFEPSFEDRQWTDYFDVELSYSTLENIPEYKDCASARNASLACISFESTSKTYKEYSDANASYRYEHILDNLVPGKPHFFRVYAVIASRRGRARLCEPRSITPPIQTPNAPLDLHVTHKNGSILRVTWNAPNFDGGSKITKYHVTYHQTKLLNSSHSQKCNPAAFTNEYCGKLIRNSTLKEIELNEKAAYLVEISNLHMGVFYNINVTACNSIGCGLISEHSPVKTMQPPGTPTNVEQIVHNHSTLNLLYSPPLSDGGDMVLSYYISWAQIVSTEHNMTRNHTNVTNTSSLNNTYVSEINTYFTETYSFDNGRHEVVTTSLFKDFEEEEPARYYENCSCLENNKSNISYGGCCCSNNDCMSNLCHPDLGFCTTSCSNATDCTDETVVDESERICSAEYNLCEVRCPFNVLNPHSPCYRKSSSASNESSCVLGDFSKSWTRGTRIGYLNSTVPRVQCINSILIYCAIFSPEDPVCKWETIVNIGAPIPKCKQRKPRKRFVGRRASSHIMSLVPNNRYLLQISACNRAGCGSNVSLNTPIKPMPQIIFSEKSQCIVEGKERDSYTVVLNSRPSDPVTLFIDGFKNQLENMTRRVIFDEKNWSIPVTVHLIALNDDFDELETIVSNISHSIATNDPIYNLHQEYIPSNRISTELKDNDYVGVIVWRQSLVTFESGTNASYEIQLRSRPLHDVFLSLYSGNDILIQQQEIRFLNNTIDFRTNHTVIVSAVADNFDDPFISTTSILHTATTDDNNYDGIQIPNVTVDVIDDDTAGIVVTPTALDNIDEGSRMTYDLSLTAQPRAPVVVLISLNPAEDGMLLRSASQYIHNESSLSFSTKVSVLPNGDNFVFPTGLLFDVDKSNWMLPKTFTLDIIDDKVDLGSTYNVIVQHSTVSDDWAYNCEPCSILLKPSLNVSVNDNDVARILVSRKNLVVTEDGSRIDFYFIELESAPRSVVSVSIRSMWNQVLVSPQQVIFTSYNHNHPVRINVSAIDDSVLEDQVHFDMLNYEIDSQDNLYANIIIAQTNLRIIDASAVVDTSPAPKVLRVVQADHIKEININFDRQAYVEHIGVAHNKSCDEFFSSKSVQLFGLGSFCYWHSRSQLTIREGIPTGEHAHPGSAITLIGGVIRSTLTSIIFSEGTFILESRTLPPKMTSAYYGESGAEIFVNFTGSCYDGFNGNSGGTLCDTIFQNSRSLGTGAFCSWASTCLLRIDLGFGSTIRPAFGLNRCGSCECKSCLATPAYINYAGYSTKCSLPSYECTSDFCYCAVSSDVSKITLCPQDRSLRLQTNAVKPLRYSILSASGCIKIDVPPNVVEPVASIKVIPQASICNEIVIDGTNSITSGGGRDNVTWSVTSIYAFQNDFGRKFRKTFDDALRNISRHASSDQTLRLSIPQEISKIGHNGGIRQIFVKLRIENIIGDVSIKSTLISLSDASIIHPIIYANETLIIRRKDVVVIRGGLSASCGGSNVNSIKFKWYITKSINGRISGIDTTRTTTFENGKVIKIPSFFLEASTRYNVELQIIHRDLTKSTFITILVVPGIIKVDVGADRRQHSLASPLLLDASRSFSEDIDPIEYGISGNKLSYSWSCSRLSGHSCFIKPGINAYTSQDGNLLKFPGFLFIDTSAPYFFTVTVSHGSNSVTKTAAVYFVEKDIPSVSIVSPKESKINPSKKFILRGILNMQNYLGTYTLKWEEISGYLDAQQESKQIFGSPLDQIDVVLLPNVLLPGRSYTFRINIITNEGKNYAETTISTNKPPSSGYIRTYPEISTTATTRFTTYADSWTDEFSDLPLTYKFSFVDLENNHSEIPISTGNNFASAIQHSLPFSKGIKYYRMIVTVTDKMGAFFSTSRKKDGSEMIVKVVSAQGLNSTWYKEKSKTTSYLNSLREMNHNDLSFKILSLAETLNAENPCASSSVNCSDIVQKHYVNASCNDNYDKYGELKFSQLLPCVCLEGWTGKYCHLEESSLQLRITGRKNLVNVMKDAFEGMLVTANVIQQQAISLSNLMNEPEEMDIDIVENSISHLNVLLSYGKDIALFETAGIVAQTVETIIKSAKMPPRFKSERQNHTHDSYLGLRSHVANLILNLSSGISRALLNDNVPGEFQHFLISEDFTLWAKRENSGGFYDINLNEDARYMESAVVKINSSRYEPFQSGKIDISVVAINLHYKRSISSAIVSVEIFDPSKYGSSPLEWKNLPVPIELQIPLSLSHTISMSKKKALCSYWNSNEGTWSVSGIFTSGKFHSDRVINCQTTHLSRFTLISANLLSTLESRLQVSTNINNIFVYDTFNSDMVLAMALHGTLFVITGILMWYFVQKYDIMRDKRPMQSFLLYGSTDKADSRPLLYRQRRTPQTLMHRIRHGFETNHALVSCIIDTVEKRMSALANFITFTMTLFIIMCVSSYIVGMINTTTVDSGKSYTDLNPFKPILWTVAVSTLVLYLLMIVRNYILVERSNFGRVIDVTSGSLSFIFLSLLRLFMFSKSILLPSTSHNLLRGLSLYMVGKSPAKRWRDFETLHIRALAYASKKDQRKRQIRSSEMTRHIYKASHTYERYVVETIMHGSSPLSREIYHCASKVQAMWRGYSVRLRRTIFENHHLNIIKAHQEINKKYFLPTIPQHCKSVMIILQAILVFASFVLGVYGLHSFQYLFVTPYASACLITGLFIANGAIFSIYLLKYTSGRILYVVPSLAILILVILISFSFEMENVETLSEANWDDVRSIWIMAAKNSQASSQLDEVQANGKCCGFEDKNDYPVSSCRYINITESTTPNGCHTYIISRIAVNMAIMKPISHILVIIQSISFAISLFLIKNFPLHLRENEYVTKSERDKFRLFKELLFLEPNGKVVASSILLTKAVFDVAAIKIQSMVRQKLGRIRKLRYLEIAHMRNSRIFHLLPTLCFIAFMLLLHVYCSVVTFAYSVKFDSDRQKLWEQTYLWSVFFVFVIAQPLVIIFSEVIMNFWIKPIMYYLQRWSEILRIQSITEDDIILESKS